MFDDNSFIVTEYEDYLKKRGRKPSTINLQLSVIKNFIKKYNLDKYNDYNRFLEEHTIKKRSSYYYDTILSFVKWYHKDNREVRSQIIDAIVMTKKHIKDPIKKTLIIDETQSLYIIKSLENPKHALISWIQKETGVRAGDCLRLKRDNIKFSYYKDSEGKVSLTIEIMFVKKGDKISKVPIFNPYLINYIKERLAKIEGEEQYVFIDRDVVHKRFQNDDFRLARRNYVLYWLDLQQTCQRLGLDPKQFTSHDWRRNFANRVWVDVLDKKDIIGLQRALGHSHIDSTVRYLRQSGLESQDIFKKAYDLNKK